jgi:hypothetical protein
MRDILQTAKSSLLASQAEMPNGILPLPVTRNTPGTKSLLAMELKYSGIDSSRPHSFGPDSVADFYPNLYGSPKQIGRALKVVAATFLAPSTILAGNRSG